MRRLVWVSTVYLCPTKRVLGLYGLKNIMLQLLTVLGCRKCKKHGNCTCFIFCSFSTVVSLVLIDFSLTVKAATLIFISGRGSAISSAKQGLSGYIE